MDGAREMEMTRIIEEKKDHFVFFSFDAYNSYMNVGIMGKCCVCYRHTYLVSEKRFFFFMKHYDKRTKYNKTH